MAETDLNALAYKDSDSTDTSSSSSSDEEYQAEVKVSNQNEKQVDYDSDTDLNTDNKVSSVDAYKPCVGENLIIRDSNIIILLRAKEKLCLSGLFDLKIEKGGLLYNDIHFNASSKTYHYWHPLSNSIPEIKSSFYAGFEDVDISAFYAAYDISPNNDYETVLKISNHKSKSLIDGDILMPSLKSLWITKEDFLQKNGYTNFSFDIIMPATLQEITTLNISKSWTNCLQKLKFINQNSIHDTRIMVIGGKNSGKSTFLRSLVEKVLYSHDISDKSVSEMLYLDLDPGQPEFSHPDCISMTRLTSNDMNFGQSFGQASPEVLKQYYIGSPSPQEYPTRYLNMVNKLITEFEDTMFAGISCINLPGWVKGFGLNILQKVLEIYKPTDIVYLESPSTVRHFSELRIPKSFSSTMMTEYSPRSYRIPAEFSNAAINNSPEIKFAPSDIRTYKLLCLFHRSDTSNVPTFDFRPLIAKSPKKISYGRAGIHTIIINIEFALVPSHELIQALEGTIVAIYHEENTDDEHDSSSDIRVLSNDDHETAKFITLGLVHSVDKEKKYFNIYVPENMVATLKNLGNRFMIERLSTETPFCELSPPNKVLKTDQTSPFISFKTRKKYEHVWKIRKNIKRKGHHL